LALLAMLPCWLTKIGVTGQVGSQVRQHADISPARAFQHRFNGVCRQRYRADLGTGRHRAWKQRGDARQCSNNARRRRLKWKPREVCERRHEVLAAGR
jgi:hypothetical protein